MPMHYNVVESTVMGFWGIQMVFYLNKMEYNRDGQPFKTGHLEFINIIVRFVELFNIFFSFAFG